MFSFFQTYFIELSFSGDYAHNFFCCFCSFLGLFLSFSHKTMFHIDKLVVFSFYWLDQPIT